MAIPSWVGPVASGALGFVGSERANTINQREAERNRRFQQGEADLNRRFQERMRNSEWQAAVADMTAAGINPAVAYSRGGASAPSGSMAGGSQAAPAHDSVSSAMQAQRVQKDLELMTRSIEKIEAEGRAADAIATREEARNRGYGISRAPDGSLRIDYNLPGLVEETQAGVRARIAEAARASSMAEISGLGGQVASSFGQFMPALERLSGVAGRGSDSVANVAEFLERFARMRDDTARSMFGVTRERGRRMLDSLRRARRRS